MIEVHLYQIENSSNSLRANAMVTHDKSIIIGWNYVESLCVCAEDFEKLKLHFIQKCLGKLNRFNEKQVVLRETRLTITI